MLKAQPQLILQFPSGGYTQSADKLPKIDGVVLVLVKRAEDVLRKLRGVPVREEAGVDDLELVHGEVPAGAVLQEPLVPLLELVLGELCAVDEVLDDLRT